MPLGGEGLCLGLAEVRKYRVDELKGLINLLSNFGAGEHYLPRDEDKQHDFGLHHSVDETGEEFRLVRAEHVMASAQALKSDLVVSQRMLPRPNVSARDSTYRELDVA